MKAAPFLLCLFVLQAGDVLARPFRVGVLAKDGVTKAFNQWNSTFATYLSEATGMDFEMVPLDFKQIYPSTAAKDIDFLFTNPSQFVCAELRYGLQALVTMLNLRNGFALNSFGGVIFRSADRPDIATIEDAMGKSFEAVSAASLGGFQMGWREMENHGLNPFTSPSKFRIGGTHPNVVSDVINGVVDVGTVRTDTLERLVASGTITMDQIVVLAPKDYEGAFPFVVSTVLYPEWNLAALDHVTSEVKRAVSVALMELSHDNNQTAPILKTAKIDSWVPPSSYVPVYSTLRDLGLVDEETGQCIEFESAYDAVICPAGYAKVPESRVYDDDCPENRVCMHTPCLPFCPEGTFDNEGTCEKCPEGMYCAGFEAQPVAQPGYMMLASDPLGAYKCLPADACPGGPPDTCNYGRVGMACATCPVGFTLRNGACEECEGSNALGTMALWILVLLAAAVIFFWANGQVVAKPTVMMVVSGNTALLVTFMQVVGILGFLNLRYPGKVKDFIDFFAKFALQVDEVLPVSCGGSGGNEGYLNSVMIVPVILVSILSAKFLLDLVRFRWRMSWSKTLNALGAVMMIGFTTLANLALTPLMCMTHPNGTTSILKYPAIHCDFAGAHLAMVLGGLGLLVLGICFSVLCVHVICTAPRRSASPDTESATMFHSTYRFLLFPFRLDRWFWGLIILPRGLLLSLTPVITADDERAQCMMTVGLSLLYLVFMMSYAPWKVPGLTILDGAMWATITFFVVFVASFSPSPMPTQLNSYDVFLVLTLAFVNGILALSLVLAGLTVLCRGRFAPVHGIWLMQFRKSVDLSAVSDEFVQAVRGLDVEQLKVALREWQHADVEVVVSMSTILRGSGFAPVGGKSLSRLQWTSGSKSNSQGSQQENGQKTAGGVKVLSNEFLAVDV